MSIPTKIQRQPKCQSLPCQEPAHLTLPRCDLRRFCDLSLTRKNRQQKTMILGAGKSACPRQSRGYFSNLLRAGGGWGGWVSGLGDELGQGEGMNWGGGVCGCVKCAHSQVHEDARERKTIISQTPALR